MGWLYLYSHIHHHNIINQETSLGLFPAIIRPWNKPKLVADLLHWGAVCDCTIMKYTLINNTTGMNHLKLLLKLPT